MRNLLFSVIVFFCVFTCPYAHTDDVIETFTSNVLECHCGENGFSGTVVIIGQTSADSTWASALNWSLNSNGLREKTYSFSVTVPGLHIKPHNGTGSGYNRRGKILHIIQYYDEDENENVYTEKK